ncbi:MAG: putative sulfate exporter family transporter [Myxococcota bacterium]|nr:putative sulfate exporter family transporter [Myxococcota bacterium]
MAARYSKIYGFLLALAIAVGAYLLHTRSSMIDPMLVAIVVGVVIRNAIGLSPRFVVGVKWCVLTLMPLGIVLMGARLNFFDVVRTSAKALVISVICVTLALAMTVWMCRKVGVGQKLGILIAIGTAICGGTAIAVAAPVIEADDNDTAFAITTVTIFGLVAVFVLPLLGHAFGMSELELGVWAGTSIHQTPQVVAAGFSYGPIAGDVATIVKLVRVLLLAPIVIGLSIWYARQKRAAQIAHVTKVGKLSTLFPPFILGFVVVALAATLHLIPDFTLHLQDSFLWDAGEVHVVVAKRVTWLSTFILTIAMAGVGLGVDLRGLKKIGLKALYVGLASAVLLAVFSLVLLSVIL